MRRLTTFAAFQAFIRSPSLFLFLSLFQIYDFGSSLLHAKEHWTDCGPQESRGTKGSREGEEGDGVREREKKGDLFSSETI